MNIKKIIKFYNKIDAVGKKNCLKALEVAQKYKIEKKLKKIESSFNKNKYWKLFFLIGFFSKNITIYDHGVLHGYSLFSFAFGKLLSGCNKKIIGQDLFEKYKFNKSTYFNVQKNINKFKLNKVVLLKIKNLMKISDYKKNNFILKKIKQEGIHMIDLSNCGTIVNSAIKNTDWKKVKYLIFEGGGSKQRDNVTWMRRQNRKKIVPALNVFKKKGFEVLSLKYFPSLSVVKKNN
jgi:hypothetical protein